MGDVTPQMHVVELALDPEQRLGQLAAEEDRDPLARSRDRRQVVDNLAPRAIGQVHSGMRQRDPREHVGDMARSRSCPT